MGVRTASRTTMPESTLKEKRDGEEESEGNEEESQEKVVSPSTEAGLVPASVF